MSKIRKISEKDVGEKEKAQLHPHFGLIKEEDVIKRDYYRGDDGKLWEVIYQQDQVKPYK